ncbi:MAG: hypothetical protein V2A79_02610 [Planctomycetota bacterium]
MTFDTGKLELYRAHRPELAHLTVLWKTKSGQIDVHLTYGHEAAMSGPGPKTHEALIQVYRDELEALGTRANEVMQQFVLEQLAAKYHRFRPGWLARNGYVVQVVAKKVVLDWLAGLAPKRRGKHRLDPETAFDLEQVPSEFLGEAYDPGVLHVLREEGVRTQPAPDADVSVCAVRPRRGKAAADTIMLSYMLGLDGRVGWWGMANSDALRLQRVLLARFFDWAIPLVRPHHGEAFEKLVVGLGLDESSESQRFAQSVRQFLRDPRNPIRQPYPGMVIR